MELTHELLERYDKPGPRYTSYPTAPVWQSKLEASAFDEGLANLRAPCGVYVHVPFCEQQCIYCACNMVVAGRKDAGYRYLDAIAKQVEGLKLTADKIDVERIHLGGGTPTWLEPDQLEILYRTLFTRFSQVPGSESSVEIDPEVTTDEQVEVLASLGVTRLSLGVQSLNEKVLEAVHRPQRGYRVVELLHLARTFGMKGLNLDLMYGLPFQTPETFAETLDDIVAMDPDRISVFGYAHVPWAKPHQRQMPEEHLPGPQERMALFLLAREKLESAGYVPIGLDHFAKPDDQLAISLANGTLHRNFMGYTTRPDLELIGVGPSAISEFRDRFIQQRTKLGPWYRAVDEGENIIEKGLILSVDDQIRRDIIASLMCQLELRFASIDERYSIVFEDVFKDAIAALKPLEDDGLVELLPGLIRVTALGRLFVRNIAMPFDAYLKPVSDDKPSPRFSRTV